jgi:hypothetical protein
MGLGTPLERSAAGLNFDNSPFCSNTLTLPGDYNHKRVKHEIVAPCWCVASDDFSGEITRRTPRHSTVMRVPL